MASKNKMAAIGHQLLVQKRKKGKSATRAKTQQE